MTPHSPHCPYEGLKRHELVILDEGVGQSSLPLRGIETCTSARTSAVLLLVVLIAPTRD